MKANIRVDQWDLITILYDQRAFDREHAMDLECLSRTMSLKEEKLRLRVKCLVDNKIANLNVLRIRSRVIHTVHLTPQGRRLAEERSAESAASGSARSFDYLDFDLRLALTTVGMEVEVLTSPSGNARGVTSLPTYSADDLISMRDNLAKMGDIVGAALLPGDVRLLFEKSMAQVEKHRDQGLRIRLRSNDAGVISVPWEIARVDGEYLSLRVRTPLVRYPIVDEAASALAVDGPLRILGIISNPIDLAELDADRERAVLERALRPLAEAGKVELTWLHHSQTQLLQCRLRQDYHIIHFVGHGYYDESRQESSLAFVNEDGASMLMSSKWLATLLRDSTIRFVFLNSCASARSVGGITEELVRRGVSAAVGFQWNVLNKTAIAFAGGFYAALSDGWPVDAASVEGRKAIVSVLGNDLNNSEWAQPILYLRSPNGLLFR